MKKNIDNIVPGGGGRNRIKFALFIFLFSLCMFTGSTVLMFAALSGSFGNTYVVNYTAPKDATLLSGQSFNKALKFAGGGTSCR